MDIEIPRVFYNTPRDGRILLLRGLRQLCRKFADLNNTHAACVLEHLVVLKSREVVLEPFQIVFNPLTVPNDFFQKDSVTLFDKATPHLSQPCLKS